MSATVTQLGARALRKIGVAIVPDASRPASSLPTFTAAQIAVNVLRELGIVTDESTRPASLGTVTQTDIAERALRAVGVSFVGIPDRESSTAATYAIADIAANVLRDLDIQTAEGDRPTLSVVTSQQEIADRALRNLGINPIAAELLPSDTTTITQTEVADRALRMLGVNPIGAELIPADTSTISQAEIGARALRMLGVNPFGPITAPGTETTYTAAQVATLVLQELGIISSTESPASQDQALALTRVEDVHEAVTRLGMASWIASVIPARAVEQYVIMAAVLLAPTYGEVRAAAFPLAAYDRAQKDLMVSALAGADGQTIATNEVATVHSRLYALGLCDWLLTSVPGGAGDAYVRLTAAQIASTYGVQMDPASVPEAEAQLRRIALSGVQGQTIAANEVASVHSRMIAEGMASWTLSTIPGNAADAYVNLTAAQLSTTFGQPLEPAMVTQWEGVLRRIALSGTKGQTIAENKVAAIHDGLVAGGLVTWAVTAIPQAFAEDYVQLVCQVMDLSTGAPTDVYAQNRQTADKEADAARERIRRGAVVAGALERAEAKVSDAHEEMLALGLVTWPNTAIPAYVADSYQALATQAMGPSFGRPFDQAAYDAARTRVRMLALASPEGQALAMDKVAFVHDAMSALGVVSWPLTALPVAFGEDYALMASTLLAPIVGGPTDPAATQIVWDGCEGRLRKSAQIAGAGVRATEKVEQTHEEMNALGLVSWTSQTIPASCADAYETLAVELMGPSFGRDPNPDMATAAKKRIRRVAMGGPVGQALAEQKVWAVHSSLDALGKIRWTLLGDLPDWAEEPYVVMAAALLAPEFEIEFDPQASGAARRIIARGVAVPASRRAVVMDAF